ncbi:cupin domain-containing protein [Streptomyces antimicrobicus]|uniref:Cupin domain-containing protein n=1 Tax=Streptomyces antimicrobicus TaxID=2883108 RepID=A0ABS8BAK9_9ACTN|nr:cupin domain-containing protein [Streptomyces antimicrobicus]MCB5181662.1 cupin domain-containing protein [Streptomyces antimicrobicus]
MAGSGEGMAGRVWQGLPGGVEVYRLLPDGGILLADREGVRELGPEREFLRFIDDGQFAHYLVGDAATSPERPSNATVKLGVVGPRSAFTPHAHGGEHFVLSLGHAACGLHDPERDRVADVPLAPGMLIRIPEMMPHSFANRGTAPLTILAANTGYGIDHEDYAITAAEAQHRADQGSAHHAAARRVRAPRPDRPDRPDDHADPVRAGGTLTAVGTTDYHALAAALRDIEHAQRVHGIAGTTVRERLAARLRRVAAALEVRR